MPQELQGAVKAFRRGIAAALAKHGRDHELDEGELAACYLCDRAMGEGDRAMVIGLRALCLPCKRGAL